MSQSPPPSDPAREYLAHASDLLTQTVFASLIGGSAFLAFCLLRFSWPDVYAPRTRLLFAAPTRLGKTLLGWISMTLGTRDYDLLYSCGLDSLLVLRLFKMLAALCTTAALVGLFVVVPLKVLLDDSYPAGTSLYRRLSTAALGSEHPLVVHFGCAYVFTALVYFYFARFAYQALALRWHYLLRLRHTRPARSIMVTGIPAELATEGALKRHFESHAGACRLGSVEAVEIVPRIAKLGVVVRRRERLLRAIEETVALVLGNPCTAVGYDREHLVALLTTHHTLDSPSGVSDAHAEALQLLRLWSLPRFKTARGERRLAYILGELLPTLRKFHHADGVVGEARRHWFASYDGRAERSSSVGFVTFGDAASAHLAAQSFTFAQPFQLRTELAPEPRDVYWDNAALPLSNRMVRGAVALATYALMLVYWLTMAFLVSTLVSIDSLKGYFPQLPELADRNKWLRGLFQYTTPTFVLSVMNSMVPYFLTWMAQASGLQSRSMIQGSVLRRYFGFLIANVLLIFTVSRTVLTDYEKWVENPALIPKLFATNLPKAAPFFMDYIILFALGYYPLQLLQFGSIMPAMLRRLVCHTPRQFADSLRPNSIDWAYILPQPMLVFVIAATYSSLAPLIFVLAAVYYVIAYVVTKYLVYYVYARQFETAGEFIIPVLKLLTGSLWHYYCLIIGLCALNGAIGYVILLFPLLWVNWYLLSTVSSQFYEDARYLPLGLLSTTTSPTLDGNSSIRPIWQGSQATIATESGAATRPSHATSTDYLLPHVLPTRLGDFVDSSERPSTWFGKLWWLAKSRVHWAWALVFSKIYIDPQSRPSIFYQLDLLNDDPEQDTRAELTLGQDQRQARSEPDEFTDFGQSPTSLLDGVLDEGLAFYEHPYLVSSLPQLWLPMAKASL
ncbi:hypothetical protein IWW39_004078 [Coemansia spiralis]|uniref:DUF221-domain-containing protein n=1 Tax=Coemansia spiralis TaxID=417178 RepID=A0A9W8GCM4_9FUNG|nr:hypothetical protein IWW39_004078 [Coemansia spiralis]